MRKSGLTRDEIAERYGVTLSTVKRWISSLQVSRLQKGEIPKRSPKPRKKREPKLSEGYTVLDIAQYRLGKRLSEDWRGYLLDGHPCNLDDILAAAKLSQPGD